MDAARRERALKALVEIIEVIKDLVRDEPRGVPSGSLFSALETFGLSFDSYSQIISGMVEQGVIIVKNHTLFKGPKI